MLHIHPGSRAAVRGIRLPIGAILQEEDLYDCSDGRWMRIPPKLAGTLLRKGPVIFIRPDDPKEIVDSAEDIRLLPMVAVLHE